jgi:4-carboxymuconolactone decarboxylase
MTQPSNPPRFTPLEPDRLTAEQRKAAEQLFAGSKRADGPSGRYMAASGKFPGPYDFLLRSPELALRWKQLAEYLRFETSVPLRLNELAILIQARYWTAQFEWWAHYPLALRAGLPQSVADDVKQGRRPAGMQPDEEAVYVFCVELMRDQKVGDATFARLRAVLSEQQVVDLVAVTGFYATVSMILNTVQAEIPTGEPPPLPPLAAPLPS